MSEDDILILSGHQVKALLAGQEMTLLRTVQSAYETHAEGKSSLPHSTFLRFPAEQRNRIIALPAYLGDGFGVAGIKWISSFPGNLEQGLERASAIVVLNSPLTGRPHSIIEGSIISAKRTAASAALAAKSLQDGRGIERAATLGCGLINFEVVRFLRAASPELSMLTVYDIDAGRADQFKRKCQAAFNNLQVEVAPDTRALLGSAPLVSIGTTAVKPHIFDLAACPRGSVILHLSLRDLSPAVVLSCDNVVDDVDHVCRAQTSIHLAEQLVGNRDFIRCTLAEVLSGAAPARRDADGITVFSPFGLGVLDLAVGKLVHDLGRERGMGTVVESFLPRLWQGDAAVSMNAAS